MKTFFFSKIGLVFGLVLILMFTSCQSDEFSETSVLEEDPEMAEDAEESDPTLRVNNSLIFPTTARPFGKSNEDWAIEFGKAVVSLDCEAIFKSQMLKLSDKVIAPFGSLESSNDEYTITRDQNIFLSPAFFFNDYPCPAEFDWEPAEGQSLEDFLKESAKEIMGGLEIKEITIDGNKIEDTDGYRLSTDLFHFTGNPELKECFDPCITGESQPAVIDGYFMMLKKLKVGKHTIVVKGEIPSEGFSFDWNLVLNVTK